MEIRGRFLPSRVYIRWKWTVRFGLLVVSFLVLLAGGLVLYLTPSSYRSSTLIEVENGPPPQETVELLRSRMTLDLVSKHLDLVNRLETDREEVFEQLREMMEVKVVSDTRLIEIAVTFRQKLIARDVAEELPASLREYLVGISKSHIAAKAEEFDKLIREASDVANDKAAALANLEKVHGSTPADESAATLLQRARRASLLADAEVERLRILRSECLAGHLDTLPRVNIHSGAVVAGEPAHPKIGPELNQLAIRSLVIGLLAALLLPYLMEFAFPPRVPRFSEADSTAGL